MVFVHVRFRLSTMIWLVLMTICVDVSSVCTDALCVPALHSVFLVM